MKWLGKFKKRRHEEEPGEESDAQEPECADPVSPSANSRAGSKPLLKDWFQARAARSAFSADSKKLKTTEKLQVSKAGVTTLINRTYIVIKHIGSGTYGQVKLAFNVRDKKLYAIKACRKSQLGVSNGHRGLCKSGPALTGRAFGIPRSRRSLPQLPKLNKKTGEADAQPQSSLSDVAPASSCDAKRQHSAGPDPMDSEEDFRSSLSQPQIYPPCSSAINVLGGAKFVSTPVAHPISENAVLDAANAPRQGQPSTDSGRPTTSGRQVPASFWGPRNGFRAGSNLGGLSRRKAEEFVREIAIMKKLVHENIVKLVEVIDDPASDNLLLVMEYVEGHSLQPKKIGAMRWETVEEMEAWHRARDVVRGLDYLHMHGVVHGDLKPANLMQDSSSHRVKIVDFGSAVLSSTMMHPGGDDVCEDSQGHGPGPMSCTPAFRSPESLHSGYRPSTEMDMWAFGVTIHMWVYGALPFSGTASFLIYEAIKSKELELPAEPRVSDELKDFLRRLLDKNASSRLNVVSACLHPWITNNGTMPLEKAPLQRASAIPPGSGDSGGPQPLIWTPQPGGSGVHPANSCPLFSASGMPGMGASPVMGASPAGPLGDCVGQTNSGPQKEEADGQGGLDAFSGCLLMEKVVSAPNSPLPPGSSAPKDSEPAGFDLGAISACGPEAPTSAPLPIFKAHLCGPEGFWRMGSRRPTRGGAHEGASSLDTVTPEEMAKAISKTVGGSAVAELMGMVLEEVILPAHTVFISAGDPVDKLYLIARGEVELYQDLVANPSDGLKPIISGVHAEDVDMDEEDDELPKGFLDSIPTAGLEGQLGAEDSDIDLYGGMAHGGPMDSVMRTSSLKRSGARCAPAWAAVAASMSAASESFAHAGSSGGDSAAAAAGVHASERSAGLTSDMGYSGGGSPNPAALLGSTTPGTHPTKSHLPSLSSKPPGSANCPLASAHALNVRVMEIGEAATSTPSMSSAQRSADNGSGTTSSGLPHEASVRVPAAKDLPYVDSASNQIVLASKGPGDSLGLPSLHPQVNTASEPTWHAHVRTVSDVVMFKADVSSIHRLIRLYPELEQAMKSIVVQQQTDLKVAEALRELRLQAASSSGHLKPCTSTSS